ncbi:MAG: LytTR family transcriptional regulator DNA-binding domain-containing protein [Clostridia bacterium]|nr:LytTR family transcriptional regulator DNA-binding domain-containing protein [Clostridia bacterium]
MWYNKVTKAREDTGKEDGVRIRTELSDTDEIVIRCREKNDRVKKLEIAIEEALLREDTLTLSSGGADYFIPKGEILYFESSNGSVYAHTASGVYVAHYKLCELESLMAPTFTRISKSAIANVMMISSVKRELVGNGELTFYGSDKTVWFSRAYFKLLQYKLDEMRN